MVIFFILFSFFNSQKIRNIIFCQVLFFGRRYIGYKSKCECGTSKLCLQNFSLLVLTKFCSCAEDNLFLKIGIYFHTRHAYNYIFNKKVNTAKLISILFKINQNTLPFSRYLSASHDAPLPMCQQVSLNISVCQRCYQHLPPRQSRRCCT